MKNIHLLFLTLALLCGCSSFEEQNAFPSLQSADELRAGFAENATKTYIENGKHLRWHADDRLTAFYGNTLNRQYRFKGETGDNSGTFALVPNGELGAGNSLDAIYALYPYSESAKISDEGIISLTLPATQSYAENSFGRGANTMVAVTENVAHTYLAFKNVCGYLKLKLYGNAAIKSIEVVGNNNEKIAGAATTAITFGGAPVTTMAATATTSVTLDCGEGITLGTTADAATEFWIVLPETTFTKGLTIKVTDTDGGIFEKSTDNEVTITRNEIQPMAAVEVICEISIPNNQIWYTATEKVEPYNAYDRVAGADGAYVNIVTNIWDATTGKGIISFDKDIVWFEDNAFSGCHNLTSMMIPNSILRIGESMFYNCTNLTRVILSKNIYEIGASTFYGCSSLTNITIPNNVREIVAWTFGGCSSLTNISFGNKVTEIGNYALSGCSSLANIIIPDSVAKINNHAFDGCTSLTNITIPNGVTSISSAAFRGCVNLAAFYGKFATDDNLALIVDGNLVAFALNCNLMEYNIPNNVSKIGYGAFYRSALTSVTIPNSVTRIEGDAFYNCSNLTSIYCQSANPPIGGYAMFGGNASGRKIYIPYTALNEYKKANNWSDYISDFVTYDFESGKIADPAPAKNEIWYTATCKVGTNTNKDLWGATLISNEWDSATQEGILTFDSDVTTISIYAFSDYVSSVKSISIPDSITNIDNGVFGYFSNLEAFYGKFASEDNRCLIIDGAIKGFAPKGIAEYTIPNEATSIASNAFNSYTLTSVTIPNSIITIDYNPFNCESLIAFYGKFASEDNRCLIENGVIVDFAPAGVVEYTTPANATSIGDCAFFNCSELKSMIIGDNILEIGRCAFADCAIESINVGNGVLKIGEEAFSWCNYLKDVVIGNGVTTICGYAFVSCGSLTNIVIPDNVRIIDDGAFAQCNNLTSATIGKGVTTLSNSAFASCYKLISVYCKPTTPPTATNYIFESNSGLKIYVPRSSLSSYKYAKYWSMYSSYYVGYDF